MPDKGLLVVALGGNAMQDPRGDDSVASDFTRTRATAAHIAELVRAGWRVVVTHGNGPQVGNHLYRAELAHKHGGVPLLPLEVCVADTQGGMGYMLQQALSNAFHEAGIPAVVTTVVTQVVVDSNDPAFADPSKPVGEVIDDDVASVLRAEGWNLVADADRGGFRRVVASPDPKEVVEAAAIRALVADGVVTIAAGGGGIPVVATDEGLQGVAAVVDKDLASALLAVDLGAERLVILTDVDAVELDHGTDSARRVDVLSLADARTHLAGGQFPAGSMGPKVEACVRFVAATGRSAHIGAIDEATVVVKGDAGTQIVP